MSLGCFWELLSVHQGVFKSYQHPFAVTYVGNSLLVIYLPLAFVKDWLLKCLRRRSNNSSNAAEILDQSSTELDSGVQGSLEIEHTGSSSNKECAVQREKGNQLVLECEDTVEILKQKQKLTAKEVAAVGFCIGPIRFVTECLMNAALSRTSVASTTLLNSTSGLFTLLISVLLGEDKLTVVKVISVIVSMGGVAMTTLGKTWAADGFQSTISNKHSLLGDLFGLL